MLESMRRGYDKARILEAFALIRSFYTNAAISADIICGFPGETDGDFHDTYEVCEKGQLLNAHIFPYSPRRNTAAAAMDGQIPAEIKKARCDELAALHSETRKRFVNSQTGENARMLIEKLSEGKSFGHTENYIYVSLPRQNRDTVGEIREFIFDPDYVINPAIK
ncbi:tRNA-2-methylthio-N(6)-dimethylallyladenosine synthase [bioreactor metagenome]|uniref:tRNA-2-methylthio-N(6)-dimethylallyladenosine synthase n=1 Tax=bioreactor metagenome TaxID=1076179 RepID=A0A645ASS4_9ZZZZ